MDPEKSLNTKDMKERILLLGLQVMVDKGFCELHIFPPKDLNEQVKRNYLRFPDQFCFQLNKIEKYELVANCDWFKILKHSSSLLNVFTRMDINSILILEEL
jgi:hypothetical protein